MYNYEPLVQPTQQPFLSYKAASSFVLSAFQNQQHRWSNSRLTKIKLGISNTGR